LNSARVAAFAAVDGGIWKQASFEGGGLQDVKAEHYKRHVPPISGAGIVYTPPQYSDHVAVAVVLECDSLMSPKVKLGEDTKTRRCQPWSRQRDVRSFFSGASSSVVENKSGNDGGGGARGGSFVRGSGRTTKKKRKQSGSGDSKKKEKKKKKGGISSFFCKK
jgi:hypothetical protein